MILNKNTGWFLLGRANGWNNMGSTPPSGLFPATCIGLHAFMKAHGHTAEYDEWIAGLKMDFDKLRNGSINP